jgi:hypothetical protein
MADKVECWAVVIPNSCAFYPDAQVAVGEAMALSADHARVAHLVEVVTCAECRHRSDMTKRSVYCAHPNGTCRGTTNAVAWFCSDGERGERDK